LGTAISPNLSYLLAVRLAASTGLKTKGFYFRIIKKQFKKFSHKILQIGKIILKGADTKP